MARAALIPGFLRSITGRLWLAVLATGILLGALLSGTVLYLLTEDYKVQFVNQVRAQSHLLATLIEQDTSPNRINTILDDLLLTGQMVHADFMPEGTPERDGQSRPREDFFFGEHGDQVYYVAVLVNDVKGERRGVLHFGYDEGYVNERIAVATRRTVYVVTAYTAVLLIFAALLGAYIGRPLRRLSAASRDIARGHLGEHLSVTTQLTEISDLATDLEDMRRELVARNEELRAREARHRAVIDNAAEGVLTLDDQGRIESFNAAAEIMFGYTAEEVVGTPFTRFLAATEINRCLDPQGKPRQGLGMSLTAVRKNGESLPVLLSISPFVHGEETLYCIVMQDISERVMFEEKLARLAYYDPLTGLPNRRLFHDRLSQAMVRAERQDKLVGILFLDLDRFKNVNDTLGHLFGDLLLQGVTKRLMEIVRKDDTVSRMGGDEFTIVLGDISNVQDATQVAEKIIQQFSVPFHLGEHEVFVSASIGITLYPFDDNDIENLIKNADAAMYEAKAAGRNTYALYTARKHAMVSERMRLETDLRKVVQLDHLRLYYQPQVLLHYQPQIDRFSGEIVGAEALLRWEHPELGLLYPDRFIPLAEDTGMIVPIGEWVLRAACRQTRLWLDAGLPQIRISVNLSVRQLDQPNFPDRIQAILDETGLAPQMLELELTETVVLHNIEHTAAVLRRIRDMGVMISIDDFGTGHASLSHLQHLPIDEVKIDRSFVHNITHAEHNATIATSVIKMAHNLGLRVVAEGVELEEEMIFLHSQQCDVMQGYYFGRPLPPLDFAALLAKDIGATDPAPNRSLAYTKR